jgi:RNA polymerase sigma factor (TIGR02999 family)
MTGPLHRSKRKTSPGTTITTQFFGEAIVADPVDITSLLKSWNEGDATALDRLTPLVYEELRRLAHRYMRHERAGHTLQTTALVNEAYVRLADLKGVEWHDRSHFLALCAQIMRRILVDAARKRASAKRGGAVQHVEHSASLDFDQFPAVGSDRAAALCALDEALNSLSRLDPRRARVIELRFFGGLSVDETAEVMQVSPQTVMRDWKLARAWLARELCR